TRRPAGRETTVLLSWPDRLVPLRRSLLLNVPAEHLSADQPIKHFVAGDARIALASGRLSRTSEALPMRSEGIRQRSLAPNRVGGPTPREESEERRHVPHTARFHRGEDRTRWSLV